MPKREVNPYRLYVGRFSKNIRKKDIKHFFRGYGIIKEIAVMTGFGFIQFADRDDAKRAVEELNGHKLKGETIHLGFAYVLQGNGPSYTREVSTNDAAPVCGDSLQLYHRKDKIERIAIGEVDFGYNGSNVTKIPGSILKVKLYLCSLLFG